MKKLFASLTLAIALCLSACAAQPTEPVNTPVPTATEAMVTPTPTPTTAPTPAPVQTQMKPSAPQVEQIEVMVESHRLYVRSIDMEGNELASGGATFSVCGNCGEWGLYMASSCENCGAIYTDREWIEHYETITRDPDNWDIIYDISYEPFFVKK